MRTNQDGLVNDIVIVNDELVFRFPKAAWAKQALARELKVLALVRRHVDLAVPVVEVETDEFVMYRLLAGQGLHRHLILHQDAATQARIIGQLGEFLAQLHGIEVAEVDAAGIGAAGSVRSQEDWLTLYADVQRELYPLLMQHGREWTEALFAPVLANSHLMHDYSPKLVHGDFAPYHILFDVDKGILSGVLDFGVSGLGDPADDFANIILGLGESFLQKMARVYPNLEEGLARARFWAGTLELQWLLGGLRSNDPSWFAVHIGRARDSG
jgi:aminoglycoside 2''-phosphotransferase